ncbi:MAG: hypothetical protein NUW01_17380 [Gemmatimonadaceae bacterium]|nr:hypothetical protein [Gemmatimonadaceae bacterium]
MAVMLGIAACGDTPTGPVTPTEVTLKLCGDAPAWVAFQDGDGAWTEVKGVLTGTAHTYTFSMTSPIGGVAVVDTLTCSVVNWVVYGTAAELAQLYSGEQCGSGHKTITGSLAGGIAGLYSMVTLGGGWDPVYGESGSFTLEEVAPGPQDLIAARGSNFGHDRVIIRRGLDLPNDAVIPLLDFNSAEAIALDSATVSIDQPPNDVTSYVTSSIETANRGWAPGSISTAKTTSWYRGLPASAMIPGDVHRISVSTLGRYVDTYVGSIANLTVSLGPVAATPTVTTLSSATPVRMRMTTPVQATYAKVATAGFQAGTRPRWIVNLAMTEGYRGNTDSWILDVPDFGSTSGYDASWGIPAGTLRSWSSQVYDWNFYAKFVPTPGLTRRRAGVSSTSAAASAMPSLSEPGSRQIGRPAAVGAPEIQALCSL